MVIRANNYWASDVPGTVLHGFLFPFLQQVCELGSIIIITNEEIKA